MFCGADWQDASLHRQAVWESRIVVPQVGARSFAAKQLWAQSFGFFSVSGLPPQSGRF